MTKPTLGLGHERTLVVLTHTQGKTSCADKGLGRSRDVNKLYVAIAKYQSPILPGSRCTVNACRGTEGEVRVEEREKLIF